MQISEIKRTLRELKIMELMVQYGFTYHFIQSNRTTMQNYTKSLIWNDFFNLDKQKNKMSNSRYSLTDLENLDKDSFDQIIGEYWSYVYYSIYKKQGIPAFETINPDLLRYLDLPLNADETQIKKRFRELCKKYHPDAGGSSEKFIELMKIADKIK